MASALICTAAVSTNWVAFGLDMAPSTAASQIAFDIFVAGGASSSVSSKTVAMTVGALANYLLVGVVGDATSDLVTGVTYNGVAMTQLAKAYNANWVYVYGLYAPATGVSHNIVASASGSCSTLGLDAVSYTNLSVIQPNTSVSILLSSSKTAWTSFAPITTGCLGVQLAFNTSGAAITGIVATGTGVTPLTRVADAGVLSISDTNGPVPFANAVVLTPNTAQWAVQRIALKVRREESQ